MVRYKNLPFFYGWIILIISLFSVSIAYGIRFSFPVFYVSILQEFGWSRADTAIVLSINVIVYGIASPIVGLAVDRLGPQRLMTSGAFILGAATACCSLTKEIWHLYILFGVMASFGVSAIGLVPTTTVISRWFIKKRGAALGILGSGFGVAYIMASGIEYLIEQVGWRSSFIALGLLAMLLAPFIAIFQRLDPKDKGLLPDGEIKQDLRKQANFVTAESLVVNKAWDCKTWNLFKAMRTYRFWFLFMAFLCFMGIGLHLTSAHLVVFAVDQGYSSSFGAFIFSFYGLLVGIGHSLGFLSDRFGREGTATVGIVLAMLGILMLIFNKGNNTPWFMYAYGILFGMGNGIASPALSASVADIFQGKHLGSIMGLVTVGTGIGGAIGPWVAGKTFDLLGTYIPAFYWTMAILTAPVVFVWMAGPRKIRRVKGKAPKVPLGLKI